MKQRISNYLDTLVETIENVNKIELEKCAEILLQAYKDNKRVFVCGNGGSASTASHFACDINKGVSYHLTKRFKVISLVDNMATITAYSNDADYETIFVEQMINYFVEGDVVIGISGSGNSKNVLNAINYANKNGGITIGFTGFSGGKLKEIANYSINANVDDMQVSEDMHMIYVHILMKVLCDKLG